MLKLVFKKSALASVQSGVLRKATNEDKDKLAYFKKKILEHLASMEAEPEKTKPVRKTLGKIVALFMLKGGKGLPVGTIKEWKFLDRRPFFLGF
ncbi:MAG: hypothetical protein LBG87_00740 [Spirochaetaceae bacterium]|jgi:hypothetical protein|nr:hypothetical protein [Spirochaetaceae bacterium]